MLRLPARVDRRWWAAALLLPVITVLAVSWQRSPKAESHTTDPFPVAAAPVAAALTPSPAPAITSAAAQPDAPPPEATMASAPAPPQVQDNADPAPAPLPSTALAAAATTAAAAAGVVSPGRQAVAGKKSTKPRKAQAASKSSPSSAKRPTSLAKDKPRGKGKRPTVADTRPPVDPDARLIGAVMAHLEGTTGAASSPRQRCPEPAGATKPPGCTR